MKIEIISNHKGEKKFDEGFKKLVKRFRKTKEFKESDEIGCKKMIIDFIKGKLTSVYASGETNTIGGISREK